jgi:hypothetical protein
MKSILFWLVYHSRVRPEPTQEVRQNKAFQIGYSVTRQYSRRPKKIYVMNTLAYIIILSYHSKKDKQFLNIDDLAQCFKTFYVVNLKKFVIR